MDRETGKNQKRPKTVPERSWVGGSAGQPILLFIIVFTCTFPVLWLVLQVANQPRQLAKDQLSELEQPLVSPADYDELAPGVGSITEHRSERDFLSLDFEEYRVVKGDTISEIAERFNLTQDTLLSFNDVMNSRLLQIGQLLKVPNQDGIIHVVAAKETVDSIAEHYQVQVDLVRSVNELTEDEEPAIGFRLFLPLVRLARVTLQEINGELFKWPVKGYISSNFGYRDSPFTGVRQFHSGLDIAAPLGTIVKAAMDGRVISVGFDVNSGNYIILSHHSGYRTFYGHLNVITVKVGQQMKVGQKIGEVGSTGLSTGSHLHFTVYKNGTAVDPLKLMN